MAKVRRTFDIRAQPGFGLIALFTFFALYLPIAALVAYSFNAADSLSRWDGLSLRWFISAWNNSAVQDASIRSLILATWAATLATIAATMAALATTRTPPYPGLTFKYAFINQPLMVPEIVTGVALLIVFSRVKVWTGYSGLGYLILAHTAFCIPFAYLPIRSRLETMDARLEEAAADLYASPLDAYRHVTMPLLMAGIISGAMLAFVVSLDDFIITTMVAGAGSGTLPVYVYTQLKQGVTPEINAISTVLLAVSIVLVAASYFVAKAGSKHVRPATEQP